MFLLRNMEMFLRNMAAFSEILKNEIEVQKLSLLRLAEMIDDDMITSKRLSEYQNATTSPPFLKAKKILSALGIYMSDDDIRDCLKENKELCALNKQYAENSTRFISVRLKYKNLIPEYSQEQVEMTLNDRIASLYGSPNKISNYIHDLISKDLNEFILEDKR